MNVTTRFSLPLLAAGQAQKELFHNEALARIDALLHPVAEAFGAKTPPVDPSPGQLWIVGTAPTGAWNGFTGQIAIWTEGGWRFVAPRDGLVVTLRDSGLGATWREGEWRTGIIAASEVVVDGERVVASRQPAIGDPTGGAVVDAEARAAVAAVLSALRTHGLIAS
jgi:hypothetical protein